MIHVSSPKVKVWSNYNVSKEDLPPQLIRSNCRYQTFPSGQVNGGKVIMTMETDVLLPRNFLP